MWRSTKKSIRSLRNCIRPLNHFSRVLPRFPQFGNCKTLCEGRALEVAKAVLPSRSPPGHAWCIRTERADVNCLRLFRWREKRGNLNLRELAFPRARRRRGVDGSVVCDTAEARRTIKYVGLVSFRCKSEQCRKTNNINKRRLMGQSCKSALIFIQKSSDLKHQENFSKGTP